MSSMLRHIYTAVLFTWTDLKTILFPITAFACACGPFSGPRGLLECCGWIWFHQLMCNVSNQVRSKDEDALNHPWRPLSSGRLSTSDAFALRCVTAALCAMWSLSYGKLVCFATLGLIVTTVVYDEFGWSGHYIGKNFCGVFGYTTFEVGATAIMSRKPYLDDISVQAVLLSGMVIFTTLQAQDFPDVDGDAAIGRVTFPIYAPELSRIATLLALTLWSGFLGWFWQLEPIYYAGFAMVGSLVGIRYYFYRSTNEDKRSYVLFNIWLLAVHCLPLYARSLASTSV